MSGGTAEAVCLDVLDDDEQLTIELSLETVSESDAAQTIGLEDRGAMLGAESFYNGADGAGQIQSGPLSFN